MKDNNQTVAQIEELAALFSLEEVTQRVEYCTWFPGNWVIVSCKFD